jgi:predicted phage terminase large subunit-like protein
MQEPIPIDDPTETLGLGVLAARCKTDLYYLAKYILGYSKMEPHVHQELCDYTTSVLPNPPEASRSHEGFDPRKNLLLLLEPRGIFKTSVVTIAFTLQFFLNEPNARILLDSETFGKSKAFLREIQDHLMGNPRYREVFKFIHGVYPFTKRSQMKLWTDSQIILPCRSIPKKEPSISCAGIDVTQNGMHYDLIICDDLHSEKNVTNREQIQQVIDHYRLAFSLLDPGKPMIVIGTRWHELDLYQYIMDYEMQDFNVLVRSAYNPDGSLFFPEVLSTEALDKIKRRQGISIFSKQYLNQPVSDENATFKQERFIHKSLDEIKNMPMNWVLSGDPSYYDPRGTSVYGDYATLVLVGMDYQKQLYVRHITRRKMSYSEFIDEIFRIYLDTNFRDIKNMRIVIEVIGTKSLSYELANEQRKRQRWLPITEIRSRATGKEERIRGLAPFYEYGHIYHIRECPQLPELEYELLHFPTARSDDIVDALATTLEVLTPPKNTNPKPEDDDRPNRKRYSNYKPRSPLMGL